MELPKSIESLRTSVKFKLNCQEKEGLLAISKVLDYTKGNDIAVFQGVLSRPGKQIVLKVGKKEAMEREYAIAAELETYKVPNIIKFYCLFSCQTRLDNLVIQNFQTHPFVCRTTDDTHRTEAPLYFIAMPYYPMGTLYTYSWGKYELPILINVLKQIVFALCYAYSKNSFIHPDLHANNVLLRKTKKRTLSYGDGIHLELKGMYAIIMDFERPAMKSIQLLPSLERCIYTTISSEYSDLSIAPNLHYLGQWVETYPPGQWTVASANELSATIDRMIVVRFVKSEKGIKHLVHT